MSRRHSFEVSPRPLIDMQRPVETEAREAYAKMTARLDELCQLKPGWYGTGEGEELDLDVEAVVRALLPDLALSIGYVMLFPAVEGGISLEWDEDCP